MAHKEKNTGKSEARQRQGGDIVPVPPQVVRIPRIMPRLSSALSASEDDDSAIAA